MSKQIQEKALYFLNRDQKKLFGFLHIPAQGNQRKNKAILICHPIFEERVFAHLFLVNFAREACRQGYHVFRFDYYGYGDSEGEAREVTVSSMLNDIEDACDFFVRNNHLTDLCLMGYRFGATLAALFAEKHPEQKKIMLWAPIINVSSYVNKALRQTISMQTVLFKKILITREVIIKNIEKNKPTVIKGYDLATVDGYPLTKTLFDELTVVDLRKISYYCSAIYLACLLPPKRKITSIEQELCNHLKSRTNLYLDIIEETVLFWKDNVKYKNSSKELFFNCLQWIEKTGQ